MFSAQRAEPLDEPLHPDTVARFGAYPFKAISLITMTNQIIANARVI